MTEPTSVDTEHAGTLTRGDWFKIKQVEDGNYSFFKVFVVVKFDHVSVYGGDLDPNGRRQWHAFTEERVCREARPLTKAELDAASRPRKGRGE